MRDAASRVLVVLTVFAAMLFAGLAQAQSQYPNYPSETPDKFQPATSSFDYERRIAMIPMRDGVKLHTVILVPKGAKNAPILLTRTPYDADSLTENSHSSHLGSTLWGYDNATEVIVEGGYIRVVQDIRGRHNSEGDYVMNRPLHGRLNPTPVDHSTDTYDTIDWLVKNIPESNGKVGILGISYDGFLPLMALVNPHPALKVSVPMNPMVDGWMGDDWFHNGAFREQNMAYIYEQEASRKAGFGGTEDRWWTNAFDDYDLFMNSVNAGELGKLHGNARSIADLSNQWRNRFLPWKKSSKSGHLRRGARGEKLACRFLKRNGYKILFRNFRGRSGGEIDVVCRDNDTLVFVEVKTRTREDFWPAISRQWTEKNESESHAARWRGYVCSRIRTYFSAST